MRNTNKALRSGSTASIGRVFGLSLAALTLGLLPATEPSSLDIEIVYTGPEEVARHSPVSVLLFDGPNLAGGSNMVAAGHVTENGSVLSLRGLPETVYVVAVFDPLGHFTGLSGMIPGSVVGIYADDGGQLPTPVSVEEVDELRFEFDDTQRIPGDPTSVVPKAVMDADQGILEIRKYTIKPGQRERFIKLFVEKTLGPQEAAGIRVVGQFRSLENEDQFVWIRAYESQRQRAEQLRNFYLGEGWIAVQHEVGDLLVGSDVSIVAPTSASSIR